MPRPVHPIYLRLCKMTKFTLRLSPPAEYLQRHGLVEGDEFEWVEELDGSVRLRPLRSEAAE